jgi:hypothetical protein
MERPQVAHHCRPSGIHFREGGRPKRGATEDAAFRPGARLPYRARRAAFG